MTAETAIPILAPYIVPVVMFLLGWIVKAFHNQKLTAFVAKLDPATLMDIYTHATSTEGRRELAVELVVSEAARIGLTLNESTASWLVDQVVKIVKQWAK